MVRGVATPPNARLHPIALIENEEAMHASQPANTIDLKHAELVLRALHIAVRHARRILSQNRQSKSTPSF
jgi:hypothetical protein